MKAMILAAGFGKRLGEITQTTPKCLVDVGGKPILGWVIERLKQVGVTSLVINLHYLADKVKEYVLRNQNFGIEILFSYEPVILGTGGAIKLQETFFAGEDAFLVHNADVWSDIDLQILLDLHNQRKAAVTLAMLEIETSRPLLFNDSGQLIGWQNLKQNLEKGDLDANARALSFSGIQVLSHSIFKYMRNYQGEFSSISVYLDAASRGEVVVGQLCEAVTWVDIGTPQALQKLRERLG